MNKRILFTGLAALALVAVSALAAVAAPSSNSGETARQSQGLTNAPSAQSLNSGVYLKTYAEIKAHADEFAKTIPLASPDSLDDVGYASAAQQGGTSAAHLEFVMQYNARCDWYAALARDPSNETARKVVNDIPRWAGFRQADTAGPAAQASQQIAAGLGRGDLEPLRAEIAGPCNPVGGIVERG